jgi:uncharacterized protein YuzE
MRGHIIGHRHDREADALYITLSAKPYAFGEDLGPDRRIDYAADRTPIGIELLTVSRGVDLETLPYRDEIARLLERVGLSVLAGQKST